jgi:alpha-glucosidase
VSTLRFYRRCLQVRRERLLDQPFTWIDSPPGTLAFRRGDVECWINTTAIPVPLPAGELLVASAAPSADESLPGNSAAWLCVPHARIGSGPE